MEFLVAVFFLLLALPIWVAVQSFLFRIALRMAGEKDFGWPRAIVTVCIAGLVQAVFSGALFGADVGLCGTFVGFLVWSGMTAVLTDLTFGRAVVVGLVMAVLQWVLTAALTLLLVVTGIGALLGLAGLML